MANLGVNPKAPKLNGFFSSKIKYQRHAVGTFGVGLLHSQNADRNKNQTIKYPDREAGKTEKKEKLETFKILIALT